jgi:murein DD-endopeptidase MepM/ murein hydrolase activator NlpD
MNKYNAEKLFHTLDNIGITSPYGYREAIYKDGKLISKAGGHEGVDYSANGNSIPIYALDEGTVLYEGYDNSTGAIICYIRYPKLDDHVGLYYHLANTVINKGDKVTADTKIGMMGSTGYSTGNHLHFNWFPYSDYNKGFYDRKYEDFDKYVFLENRVQVTPTVERNESIPQIKVLVDELRVRTEHSTNGQVVGFVQNQGIYNDLEVYKDNDYTWHKIADNQWIADNGNWLELLPILNYKDMYENEVKTNETLKEEINSLKLKLKDINKISAI